MNLKSIRTFGKRAVLTTLSTIFLTVYEVSARSIDPASIDNIYVFGDSLVDVGNDYFASQQQIPPSPPYFQGRFSNGPVWIETVLARFSQAISPSLAGGKDFAFGGAPSGFFLKQPIPAGGPPPQTPGVLYQINTFLAPVPPVTPNTLYFLTAGANDFLINRETDPNVPVNNLTTAISELYAYGARNIVLTNLPDLGNIPLVNSNRVSSRALRKLTNIFNVKLEKAVAKLRKTRPNLNIIVIDLNGLISNVIANPTQYGLTNVTDACLVNNIVCANPDQYLFWDIQHPTRVTGQIIADFVYEAVVDGHD